MKKKRLTCQRGPRRDMSWAPVIVAVVVMVVYSIITMLVEYE